MEHHGTILRKNKEKGCFLTFLRVSQPKITATVASKRFQGTQGTQGPNDRHLPVPSCRISSPNSGCCNMTQPSTSPEVKTTCTRPQEVDIYAWCHRLGTKMKQIVYQICVSWCVNISIEKIERKHRVDFPLDPETVGLQPAPVAALIKIQQTKAVVLHAWRQTPNRTAKRPPLGRSWLSQIERRWDDNGWYGMIWDGCNR